MWCMRGESGQDGKSPPINVQQQMNKHRTSALAQNREIIILFNWIIIDIINLFCVFFLEV